MASPLNFIKNFTGGFTHAERFTGGKPATLISRVRAGMLSATAFKSDGYPYVWATGSNIGGYGVEYGWGTAGQNQDIRWDKWGAAFAVVVSEPLFRCVEKRSTTVGATPWQIIDNKTEDVIVTSKDIDSDNPLARALFRFQKHRDNEGAESLFTMWERARCIAGEVFIELIPNETKAPADVEWLNPLAVWINAPVGRVQYFQYTAHGRSVIFSPDELVYHRLAMDMRTDVFGYSPVMAAIGSGTLNVLRNSSRTLEAFFRNDATPRNIVTPAGDFAAAGWGDSELDMIQATLARIKGTAAKYNTSIFPYPINFDQFELPDLDKWAKMLQDIEPRVYTVMGVPRSVAGDSDSTRYQASPDDVPNFNATILTELDAIESVVNARLVPFFTRQQRPDYRFAFDRRQYETVDPSLVNTYGQLFRDGAISLNEYRTKGGFPEIDNGNIHLLSANFITVPTAQLGAIQGSQTYLPYGNTQTPPNEASQLANEGGFDVPESETPVTPVEPVADTVYIEPQKSAYAAEIPSYCILSVIEPHSEIVRIQEMLRASIKGDVKFTDSDTFHITMVYVEGATGYKLSEIVPKNAAAFAVVVDGIGVFDTPDGYAVHLRIRKQGELITLQKQMALQAIAQSKQAEWTVSDYSIPDAYQPHITLCYSSVVVEPFDITPFSLMVSRIDLTDDAHKPVVSVQLKSAYAELDVWRRFALKHMAVKARSFVPNTLPDAVVSAVRNGLAAMPDATKDEISAFFEAVKAHYDKSDEPAE